MSDNPFQCGDDVRIPCGYEKDVKALHLACNQPALQKLRRHLHYCDFALATASLFFEQGEDGTLHYPAWYKSFEDVILHVDSPIISLGTGVATRQIYLLQKRGHQHTAREIAVDCSGSARLKGVELVMPPDVYSARSLLCIPARFDTDKFGKVVETRGVFCTVKLDTTDLPRLPDSFRSIDVHCEVMQKAVVQEDFVS